jgi:hypothetical protein
VADHTWICDQGIEATKAIEVGAAQPYHFHFEQEFSRSLAWLLDIDDASLPSGGE